MSAEPTYTEVMNGERFDADKHWIEAVLQIANEEYFRQHIAKDIADNVLFPTKAHPVFLSPMPKPVKVGDYAMCSECNQMKFIRYMYGGTKPLCKECCKEILN